MERVAVVTAPNLGYRNTGMVTVDLAFESLRRRIGGGIGADWYTLHIPEVRPLRAYLRNAELPFHFRPLNNHIEELGDYDVVTFWGDFLHARHYREQDATNRLLRFGVVTDRPAARRLLGRALLLGDAPDELLARTVLYGGTILHNTQADYDDEQYGPAFERLMTCSRAVWMREPLSAAKVAHLRRDDASAHFGADAALLLRPDDLGFLPTTGWAERIPSGAVTGVFLGSRTRIPRWLPSFCRALSRRLDTRLEWFPWFETRPNRMRQVTTRLEHPTLGDILTALSRYRLVITDTYHLCVNAWRAGTPAVCIGSPEPGNVADGYLSLNDLKKHVFHLAYDAGDFYLSTIRQRQGDRVEWLARLIENGGADAIARRMCDHAERSEVALTETFTSMLRDVGRQRS